MDTSLELGEGGGCSGLMYELDFDNTLHDSDKSFEDNGIKVVVDKKSFLYLVGTTLDFSGGLNGKVLSLIIPMQIEPVDVAKAFHYNFTCLTPKKN